MKIDKKYLAKRIEEVIAEGVINGEEVDVTTKNVINLIWPIIDFLKTTNRRD